MQNMVTSRSYMQLMKSGIFWFSSPSFLCGLVIALSETDWEEIILPAHFDDGMSLERIHRDILRYLSDNLPQDFSDVGEVSRKILFKSVNYKPRQIEKACKDLESKGFVELFFGFYKNDWASISLTDEGMDYIEVQDDAEDGI